jgi:hypothetical protein
MSPELKSAEPWTQILVGRDGQPIATRMVEHAEPSHALVVDSVNVGRSPGRPCAGLTSVHVTTAATGRDPADGVPVTEPPKSKSIVPSAPGCPKKWHSPYDSPAAAPRRSAGNRPDEASTTPANGL